MSFHIGQKVICVRDGNSPGPYPYGPRLPKRGSVYTIRAIVPCKCLGYDEDGLLLVEIVNPVLVHNSPTGPTKSELKFRLSRFRPLRITNIDVFTRMLEPRPMPRVVEALRAGPEKPYHLTPSELAPEETSSVFDWLEKVELEHGSLKDLRRPPDSVSW